MPTESAVNYARVEPAIAIQDLSSKEKSPPDVKPGGEKVKQLDTCAF